MLPNDSLTPKTSDFHSESLIFIGIGSMFDNLIFLVGILVLIFFGGRGGPHKNKSLVLVPASTSGLKVGNKIEKLGQ